MSCSDVVMAMGVRSISYLFITFIIIFVFSMLHWVSQNVLLFIGLMELGTFLHVFFVFN